MDLFASFALGGFNPWAAGFGIGSLVLFGLVGVIAGPNLQNFDPEAKKKIFSKKKQGRPQLKRSFFFFF